MDRLRSYETKEPLVDHLFKSLERLSAGDGLADFHEIFS